MYIIDTLGMEFETTARLPEEFYKSNSLQRYFRTTHDASIESPIFYARKNVYFIQDEKTPSFLKYLNHGTAGTELVSNTLNFNDMTNAVNTVTELLAKYGARDEEERAGIHVHCAYPVSHRILINTIKLSLAFESLFFHLAGLGYEFRGKSNNSIFCRPLSNFGPPIVTNMNGEYIQLLDTNQLLLTENMDSFWRKFGGIDINDPPNRYHPTRYFFINPFSCFLHSTLEFRIFNTTLNADYILSIIRFCQGFTSLTLQSKVPFDFVSSVYSPIMDSQVLLDRILYHIEIEPEFRKKLFEILERTPYPTLKEKYVCTHLRDYRPIFSDWNPKVFAKSEFEDSGFVDIHNFNTGDNQRQPQIESEDNTTRIRRTLAVERERQRLRERGLERENPFFNPQPVSRAERITTLNGEESFTQTTTPSDFPFRHVSPTDIRFTTEPDNGDSN